MAQKIVLKKGLDLPILGEAKDQTIHQTTSSQVAIVGPDFAGMKPSLLVKEGDSVSAGQVLFECKKNVGLKFCSRFDGKVAEINRGDKRVFQSMVIDVSPSQGGKRIAGAPTKGADSASAEEIRKALIDSGEWCSLRQRPFEKVADVNGQPDNLFVTAMDTNPLAQDPAKIIEKQKAEFMAGLQALAKLPKKKTFVCVAPNSSIEVPSACEKVEFKGPHPAGSPGTHIHFLDPVNVDHYTWHIGYQDVIAIGHLFLTGTLLKTKVVNVCGPRAEQPRMVETLRGAKVSDIVSKESADPTCRVISGSVLAGRKCVGPFDYLGQFHNQITVIEEDTSREFLGWQSPGLNKFSNKPIYLSRLIPGKRFALGSSTNGSKRAMVPIGMFEDVMPMDILPTQLLRALVSQDIESAQDLGCLELSEEDLALCTFVSPGKVDFGKLLRNNLDIIEKEVL